MTFLAALLAQFLHTALVLATAPLVPGLRRCAEALFCHRAAPNPCQPWRELRRLSRKHPVLAENASPVSRLAPLACFAAMAAAAALVPTFTLGMALAPLSDLLVLSGLLAFARVALTLASLDPGTAPAGMAAARRTVRGCLAEPGLFLAILALALLGGTTNLDLLIGLQRQGMLQPIAALALTGTVLTVLALTEHGPASLTDELSGAGLAVADYAEAMRQLVWLNLLAALFLPLGIAGPGDGPMGWTIGLLAWAAKLVLLIAGLAAVRVAVGSLRPAQHRLALGVAALLGLVAALLVLASAVAA